MSAQARRWLLALATLVLGFALTIGFGLWVRLRTTEHPSGTVASGQSWTQSDGSTIELVGWEVTDRLTDVELKKVVPAPEGGRFVHVQLRFTHLTEKSPCTVELVGSGQVRWRTWSTAPDLGGPSWCRDEGAGDEPVVHEVFVVPTSMVDQLRGVGPDHSMQLRQPPVLAPPR